LIAFLIGSSPTQADKQFRKSTIFLANDKVTFKHKYIFVKRYIGISIFRYIGTPTQL